MKSMKCNRKKGITVAELMVSAAILLIALVLGYNLYSYLNKSYTSTEKKWIEQQEIRTIADFLNSELKNANFLTVSSSIPASGVAGEYDIYMADGKILFRNGTEAPVTMSDGGIEIRFGKALNKSGQELDNVLSYSLTATDTGYSVDSAVFLYNMSQTDSIDFTSPGTSIHFGTTAPITAVPFQ